MRFFSILGFILLASFGANAETEGQRSSLIEMNKILFWACKHYQAQSIDDQKLIPLHSLEQLQEYSSSSSALDLLGDKKYSSFDVNPGELTEDELRDYWGSHYFVDFSYSSPQIFITSFGADKKEGGEGLDRDFAVKIDLTGPLNLDRGSPPLCYDLERIIEYDIASQVSLEKMIEYNWLFIEFYQN